MVGKTKAARAAAAQEAKRKAETTGEYYTTMSYPTK